MPGNRSNRDCRVAPPSYPDGATLQEIGDFLGHVPIFDQLGYLDFFGGRIVIARGNTMQEKGDDLLERDLESSCKTMSNFWGEENSGIMHTVEARDAYKSSGCSGRRR